VGFSFALAGQGLLIQPFKLLLFGRGGTDESGGPPPFEPSLKVEGNIGHIQASRLFLVHPAALTFSFGRMPALTYVKPWSRNYQNLHYCCIGQQAARLGQRSR
jgi:hypothetical protein